MRPVGFTQAKPIVKPLRINRAQLAALAARVNVEAENGYYADPSAARLARTAYFNEVHHAFEDGAGCREARARGEVAFKLALPPLDTRENIHAYIGAVAHGVALGIMEGKQASTLLYAAQIAISNTRRTA